MNRGLILVLLLAGSARAADPATGPAAAQQQLRVATQEVAARLQALLDEYHRNALPADDAEVLRAVQAVLANLTEQQMGRVVALLDQAALPPPTVTAAYAAQKPIILQLQQVLLDYQRHLQVRQLAERLGTLLARQAANQQEATALGELTGGRAPDLFSESHRAAWQAQQAEQEALRDELQLVFGKLEALGRVGFSPEATQCRAVVHRAEQSGLMTNVAAAVTALQQADFATAATAEQVVVRQLRTLHRLLRPARERHESLREALADLDALIQREQEIVRATKVDVAAQTKPDSHRPARVPSPATAQQQAELLPRADELRRQLEHPAPAAAIELQFATNQMTAASAALATGRLEQALPAAQGALQNLQQARQAVADALAQKSPTPPATPDRRAELQALQNAARSLQTQQERLRQDTQNQPRAHKANADRQSALAATTRDLQRKTDPAVPAAARELEQAQTQMQHAKSALAKAAPADAAQAAARDALGRADQQLEDAIQKLDQLDQQTADLTATRRHLGELIARQQQLQSDATPAAAAPQPDLRTLENLAQAQGELAGDTQSLQRQLPPAAVVAASPLRAAAGNMDTARDRLRRADARAAVAEQSRALDELYEALAALDQQARAIRPPATNDLARAADCLRQAQQHVARAQEQLQQAAPGEGRATQEAGQSLREATAAIAPVAAGQPANLPPAARAATQDAQQALAAAQMSTAAANAAQALADATAAQVALTRAAATMDAAPAAAPPAPSGQPAGRAAGPISTVTGRGDRQDADGGAPVDRPVTAAGRPAAGQFIGLPERDRQAIQQSQGELYPAEYGALVEQYLRNLADVTATGPTP